MMSVVVVIAIVCFAIGLRIYGKWLTNYFLSDKTEEMPAVYLRDDMDYFPSPFSMLFAHHFSSIAGAGAIIGPVAAGAMFGWMPALLWIVFGCIFVGGVHDLSALAVSLKHDGLSLAEVVQRSFGRKVQLIFLAVAWIATVLVVAAFLDITAETFSEAPAVGFTVTITILAAFLLGIGVYVFHLSLKKTTIFLVPFFFYSLYYGSNDGFIYKLFDISLNNWRVAMVGYCYLASVLPIWLLMEPRDYIASFFLYAGIIVGVIGMFVAGTQLPTTMLQPFYGWSAASGNSNLWPFLFITIACGAVSGAHSIISTGTTPKQLAQKDQAVRIGYGSMILEGVVGIIALGTVMMNGDFLAQTPLRCFSVGFGRMAEAIGFSRYFGGIFAYMVVNCFVLTTLDTLTRIGRYLLQELTHNRLSSYMATSITLAAALAFLVLEADGKRMWEVIWPVFGASNQLIAALTLLIVCLWMVMHKYKKTGFVVYPMFFMMATSFVALGILTMDAKSLLIKALAIILLFLALWMIWLINKKVSLVQTFKGFWKREK